MSNQEKRTEYLSYHKVEEKTVLKAHRKQTVIIMELLQNAFYFSYQILIWQTQWCT